MKCPFCEGYVKNISLHFNKSPKCKGKIDVDHFEETFAEFSKKKTQERKRVHMQNKRAATKNKGDESYIEMKEKNKQDKRNSRARRKTESQESYLKLF